MNPAPLTISLFGQFEATVHGQPLRRLRSRSLEWLLAWLVLRQGRPVSRAVLAGTLWPDTAHEPALRNLRTGLLDLRRALGPEAERLGSPTRDSLQLDLTEAFVDLLRFDAAIAAGDEGSLQEAVALYRGELLEGCHEEWIVGERAARQEACLLTLEKLADQSLGRGDPPAALSHLGRAEALDPLRDSVQQRRMLALAASGDLPAALLSYREYRLRLHGEMNLEPDPETTRLFRELQSGRPGGPATRNVGGGDRETGQRDEPVASGPVPPRALAIQNPNAQTRPPASLRSCSPRFAPPPEIQNAPTPLPRPLTTLIGREQELQEATSLVRSSPLVTLIGGGGVGKTRLALQIAAGLAPQYPGRIAFVELAPLADPALLTTVVATALGLREDEAPEPQPPGTRAAGGQALIEWLSPQPALLVLDNCEHLIEAAAEMAQALLAACPELHLLATSRQRLGLTGELAWRVPSLSAPDPEQLPADAPGAVELVLQFPAARLFLERVAGVRPGFHLRNREEALAVARICRRLDGIPLALELAAARVTVLPITQIAARLDDRFRLLTGGSRGALPRHQTLRALIDWSYDGLPEAEAALLRRLSVFAGGWTLEAAEAVCACGAGVGSWELGVGAGNNGALSSPTPNSQLLTPEAVLDLLSSLEEKSLVLMAEQGETFRYGMPETVREYARQRLRERGEEEAARRQHLQFFLRRAQEAHQALWGPGQEGALALLETEHDNLRAALEWAQAAAPELFLRLAAALGPFWEARGHLFEGRQYLRAALQRAELSDAPERAQALLGAAWLAFQQCDRDEADRFAQEGRERFRARDDFRGLADALLCLGEVAVARGKHAAGEALFAEGLAASRQCGWIQGSTRALVKLGMVARLQGNTLRARSSLEEGLALAQTVGDAPTLALAFHQLGCLARNEGDPISGGRLLEQCLEIWRRLGYRRASADTLGELASLARKQNDLPRATSFLEQATAIYRDMGERLTLPWTLQGLGNIHYTGGDYAQARSAYEESLEIFREVGHEYGIACASNNLGMTLFHLGESLRALALHREALALYGWSGHAEGTAWSLERVGVVAATLGDPQHAARLLGAASAAWAQAGKELTDQESPDLQHAAAVLRETLGLEAWESAWQAGRAMAREEAIAYALEDAGA